MKRSIERKWWFALPAITAAAVTTVELLQAAGVRGPAHPTLIVDMLLFFFTFVGCERFYRGLLWAGLVWIAPRVADGFTVPD